MSLGSAMGGPPSGPNKGRQLSLSDTFKLAWADPELRQKITFVLIVFACYAMCVHIQVPIPGVEPEQLNALIDSNQIFQLMNAFGGGAFRKISILALGLGPYITASIIMQVLSLSIPSWKMEMQEGGEFARRQQNRRTRALALIMCIGQSLGLFHQLTPALGPQPWQSYLTISVFWTCGSMLLLWAGEQVSERGIGNGVSVLIFAGIVISLPGLVSQIANNMPHVVNPVQLFTFLLLFLATTWFVVMFTQAQRRIPVQHMRRNYGTKSVGGQTSYLPISVNMAGVIPIIFAMALIYMPAQAASAFPANTPIHDTLLNVQQFMAPDFSRWQGGVAALIYMVLIFGFTFMWNSMVYNIEDIANNLKRAGSYIPGIRPGKQTKEFLNGVITRITFVGALFLSIAALVQYAYPLLIAIPGIMYVGGTSLLIMVSVALETMRQIEANLLVKQYGN